MPYEPYKPRERKPDVWTYRWMLQPAGRQEYGAPRLRPHRFFKAGDIAGLRAAHAAAVAEGFHPLITWCARLTPGNGRSPSSHPRTVHVSWLGHDVDSLPSGVPSRPRPGSPEEAEEARLDAEWEAEQAASAAAATA